MNQHHHDDLLDEVPHCRSTVKVLSATSTLARNIHFGVFEPGDKLPSITQMAAAANVKVAWMEQAVTLLAADGYIDPIAGMGLYVRHRGDDPELCHLVAHLDALISELAHHLADEATDCPTCPDTSKTCGTGTDN